MTSDLQSLIELQKIDARIAALRAEIAALPKHVAEIEKKLAGSKTKVDTAVAAAKADEVARKRHESDIQDQQQKISKYRDQSLNVKTNDEYRALMHEIKFAEDKIAASEDKILEIMVAADARKEFLKKADAELKADTAENEREKEEARQRTAIDEADLTELTAHRNQLRAGVTEDALRHYDRVLKLRGSALSEVHDNQQCGACSVMLRPQVFQEVMTNQHFMSCDYCKRILYYVPPPPKPEDEVRTSASRPRAIASEGVFELGDMTEESLPAKIAALRAEGKIPPQFGAKDVREFLEGQFADTYLNTVLANYCESTGDYVKKGQKPWFRRVSEGLYEIL